MNDKPTLDLSALTDAQRDGAACLACGSETAPMRPFGKPLGGVQLYACTAHDAEGEALLRAAKAGRPSWLPDGCPSWCEATDEHSDRDHYDDRRHFGPCREVVLTAVDDREAMRDDMPAVARAHMSQHFREVGPRITLDRDDTPVDIAFTVDEAEEFARKLLDLVAEARGE